MTTPKRLFDREERVTSECDDPLLHALHAEGYDVLATPSNNLPVLAILADRDGKTSVQGPLERMQSVAELPEVNAKEWAGTLSTRAIPYSTARRIFGDVIETQWGLYGGAASLFDGADSLTFELHDLVTHAANPNRIQAYLDAMPIDEWRRVAPPSTVRVVLSTLSARRFVVRVSWPDDRRLPSLEAIHELFDSQIVESCDEQSIQLSATDDYEPLVVGVKLVTLREVLGELRLGRPTLVSPNGPFELAPQRRGARKAPPPPRTLSPDLESKALFLPRELDEAPQETENDASEDSGAGDLDRRARRVGAGFSEDPSPEVSLSETSGLRPETFYWFWCEIGDSPRGAIGGGVPIAAMTPERAEIEVVVFTNPDGFELEHWRGTLLLSANEVVVTKPAGRPSVSSQLLERRLFFRLKTPTKPSWQKLRLSLYHRGVLLQSIDLGATVHVGENAIRPMRCVSDYALSRRFDATQLSSMGPHTLSVFVNDAPGMTHGFRFFGGGGEIATSAVLDDTKVQGLIDRAREAMRFASWGNKAEFDDNRDADRHDPQKPPIGLLEDLVPLAKVGFRMWDALAGALAGGPDEIDELRASMRAPGTIQLGLRESSTSLLPLALLYDHNIDTQIQNLSSFSLCDTYSKSADTCLGGDCPNRDASRIVCPSGFWGYRHRMGVPIGTSASPEVASTILAAPLRVLASAYAGQFDLRDEHLERLKGLVGGAHFDEKLTRKETIEALKKGDFQILYFYCHGGVEDDAPYVVVGRDDEDPNRIGRDTLRSENVSWRSPRPLVIINGCHTTALEPAQAIDIVSGFVETAHASGVVGTEITVFEPMAAAMAEALIGELVSGADLGTALRDARRKLLLAARPNLLGLAYVAFALSSLSLAAAPTVPASPQP